MAMESIDQKISALLELTDEFVYPDRGMWCIYSGIDVVKLCSISEGIEVAIDIAIDELG